MSRCCCGGSSVFAGWSLEMAEQVCADQEIPSPAILDLIAALVDKSLVVVESEVLGQARYRLLDTIREYAAARLGEAGETKTFQLRLRDYTVAVAERNVAIGLARIDAPWSARVDVFRRYDVEIGNVWLVLSGCLADGDAETGLRICTAVRPCWIVRGSFAEGSEWLASFLALDAPDVPPQVLGAGLIGRAQLTLPSDPALARSLAQEGLALCRAAGDEFWAASGLNLLAEVALHTGQPGDAASRADEALSIAQASGDGWNEGYALGIRAAIAGVKGNLREAQQLAKASIAVMRRIDQEWGTARALLGLGDLARVRKDPGDARRQYLEALVILREIDARPEIARCLAGLGRVAMDLGALALARQHLSESLRLSQSTGSRIGVARGLEAFAALATREDRPERAVQLTAAAARAARGGRAARTVGCPHRAVPGRGPPPRREHHHPALGAGARPDQRPGGRAGAGHRPGTAKLRRRRHRGPDRTGIRPGGDGTARCADPQGTPGRRAGRERPQQQGHRRAVVHQPGDRRAACRQHPGQAGVPVPCPDRRLGRRPPAARR